MSDHLGDTLILSECKAGGDKGFWLWDETRGMNLAMKARSEREAFVSALTYYQKRLKEVEEGYASLKKQVDLFISLVADEEDDWP